MTFAEEVDKNAQVQLTERQLKLYGKFFDNYSDFLKKHIPKSCQNLNAYESTSQQLCKNVYFPVSVDFAKTQENVTIFNLTETDNKILNKVIRTFAKLCEDGMQLVKDANALKLKLVFLDLELCRLQDLADTARFYKKISESLDLLMNCVFLNRRFVTIVGAILHQLAVFSKECSELLEPKFSMKMQIIFDVIESIMMQIVAFDEIITASGLPKFWQPYKKAVDSCQRKDVETISLKNMLVEIEVLFTGELYQMFLDRMIKLKKSLAPDAFNTLAGYFRDHIKSSFSIIDQFPIEISELYQTDAVIKITVMCVFFQAVIGNLETKYFKQLSECNNRYTGITFFGNILWRPEPFVKKYASSKKECNKYFDDSMRTKQNFLTNKVQHILKEGKHYCRQITMWNLELNKTLKIKGYDPKLKQYTHMCNLLHQGLQLAGQLSQMIKCLINLHAFLRVPMAKTTLTSVCKLIEYLQMTQITFAKRMDVISEAISIYGQYLEYKALLNIAVVKKKILQGKNTENSIDTLASLNIVDKCMHGAVTNRRLLITNLAMNAANLSRYSSSVDMQKFVKSLHQLDLLTNLQCNIDKLCDSSFIYWHQSILTSYLKQVVDKKEEHHSAKYLIKSSNDCRKFFKMGDVHESKLIDLHENDVIDHFKNEVVTRLFAEVEIFLRLEVHADLQQDKQNPFIEPMRDYRDLIDTSLVQFSDHYIISKGCIENYLTNTFYNLTTVSLHDWRTYDEMRHLASHKFNLDTIQNHLPVHTLEQGVDVLEIMRNIHIFASQYIYDMNKQVFIARESNSKYLTTISIKHLANSLRTHGTGVINTTVNCTYQFLRKKFYTFSQFMYDEHIKSRLIKDLKYFNDDKDKLAQTYSYARAESFNKKIRRLGMSPDGQSYLDMFRQLITHIGNAMGYVRLILSGGIRTGFGMNLYLPKLGQSAEITKAAAADINLSEASKAALVLFNKFLENSSSNFSESGEYFKLLVRAFSTSLQNPKNQHLTTFYLIIPPLTINFVEYITSAKDKINKRDKLGALFADDGFAIGIAYILKLLNQASDFDSLDWFKLVKKKYAKEKEELLKQLSENANYTTDKKLQETLSLTQKRIDAFEMEFKLLSNNLKSSTIFFSS